MDVGVLCAKRSLKDSVTALLVVIALFACSSARAQEGEQLSLERAVQKMLTQNGELRANVEEQRSLGSSTLSASLAIAPTINLGYATDIFYRDYTRESASTSVTRNGVPVVTSNTSNRPSENFTVSVSQPLWDPRFFDIPQRLSEKRSGRYRLQAIANRLVLETIVAYLEVETGREQLGYAKKNLEEIRGFYNKVRARARVDPGQRYLLNRAQARLSVAEEELSKARQLEAVRNSRLERLIGQKFGALETASKLEGIPDTIEDALDQVRRLNPEVLAARQEVRSATARHWGAWARNLPTISATYRYRQTKYQTPTETTTLDNITEHAAGIGVNYPLNLGFSAVFDAVGEKRRLKAAKFISLDTERRSEENIRSAWITASESRRIHEQAKQLLKATAREKRAYQSQFRAGQRNFLDLLNIQSELYSAQQRELQSRVENRSARYQILSSIGGLVNKFGGMKVVMQSGDKALKQIKKTKKKLKTPKAKKTKAKKTKAKKTKKPKKKKSKKKKKK